MDNSITKPFKPAQWTEMFLPLAANEPLPVQSDETKAAKMESPLQAEIFEGTATLPQCGLDRLAVKAEEILHGTRSNRDLPHERLLGQLRVSLTALHESETDPAGSSSKEDANG